MTYSPARNDLAGSGEDDDCLGVGSGRLWPLAMVGTLGGEVAHLALDRAGKGAQPPGGQPFGQDLGDRQPAGGGDLVRGKTAGGSPGGGARSATCR
jgi:hypothetical protein